MRGNGHRPRLDFHRHRDRKPLACRRRSSWCTVSSFVRQAAGTTVTSKLAAEEVDGLITMTGHVPLVSRAEFYEVLACHSAPPAVTIVPVQDEAFLQRCFVYPGSGWKLAPPPILKSFSGDPQTPACTLVSRRAESRRSCRGGEAVPRNCPAQTWGERGAEHARH